MYNSDIYYAGFPIQPDLDCLLNSDKLLIHSKGSGHPLVLTTKSYWHKYLGLTSQADNLNYFFHNIDESLEGFEGYVSHSFPNYIQV